MLLSNLLRVVNRSSGPSHQMSYFPTGKAYACVQNSAVCATGTSLQVLNSPGFNASLYYGLLALLVAEL